MLFCNEEDGSAYPDFLQIMGIEPIPEVVCIRQWHMSYSRVFKTILQIHKNLILHFYCERVNGQFVLFKTAFSIIMGAFGFFKVLLKLFKVISGV